MKLIFNKWVNSVFSFVSIGLLVGCGGGGGSNNTSMSEVVVTNSVASATVVAASSSSSSALSPSSSTVSSSSANLNKGTTTLFTNANSNLIASTSYPNGELFAEIILFDNSLRAYTFADKDGLVYVLYFDEFGIRGFGSSTYSVRINKIESSGRITSLDITDSNNLTTNYRIPAVQVKKQEKMFPASYSTFLNSACPQNPPDPEGVDFYPINTHCRFENDLSQLHPTFTALNFALEQVTSLNPQDLFLGRVAGNIIKVGETILSRAADLANNLLSPNLTNQNLPVFENNSPAIVDPFKADIKAQIAAAQRNSTPVSNEALVAVSTSNKPIFNIPSVAYVGEPVTISARNLTFSNTTIENIAIYVENCSVPTDKTIRTDNSIVTTCIPARAGVATVYFYGGNYRNGEINVIGSSSSQSSSSSQASSSSRSNSSLQVSSSSVSSTSINMPGKSIAFSPSILDVFSTLDAIPEINNHSNSIAQNDYRNVHYQIVMRANHKFFVNFLGFDVEAIDRDMDMYLYYDDDRLMNGEKNYKRKDSMDRRGFEVISLSINAYDYRNAYVYPGIPDANLTTGFQDATIKNIDGCILGGGAAKDFWRNEIYDEAHYPYPLCSEVGISVDAATNTVTFSNVAIGLELSRYVDNCPDKGTYASRLSQSCRNDKDITRLTGSVKIF